MNGKDLTLTVAGVVLEELEGDKKKETKGLVAFKETPKSLVLNKTNGLCIRAMFGRETNEWVGKRITFYPAAIDFGDADIAIRVRGSPDLAADMEFELKLPRKKGRAMKLMRTGQAARTPFDDLVAVATLNQVPQAKMVEWLKAQGLSDRSKVTAATVEAYKAALAAEAGPPPASEPF